MANWLQKTLHHPTIQRGIKWAKKTSLPGFFEVPIWDVFSLIWKEMKRDDPFIRSNSMAFSFLLALFPLMLAFLYLLPYIPVDGVRTSFDQVISMFAPHGAEVFWNETIKGISGTTRNNILSISFVLAVFFSSNAVLSMMNGFEKSYKATFHDTHWLRKRVKAVWLTMWFGILFISALILVVFGDQVIKYLTNHIEFGKFESWMYSIYQFLLFFVISYAIVGYIYRYVPSFKRKFSFFSPGATLASISIIITAWGLGYYMDNFSNYNRLYGSIGALIITMIWLQINSLIILVGFELNASIALNRDFKALDKKKEKVMLS